MVCKGLSTILLVLCLHWSVCDAAWAKVAIDSQSAAEIKLIGYNGLTELYLVNGRIFKNDKQELDTSYRGLALLTFSGGQSYPVIISDAPFAINIKPPTSPQPF